MDRDKKILKNIVAYTMGNFGSKVLSYIMVLVYTHFITSSELGYYDVVLTTVSLLQPIVLLMFDDGVYRWLVDDSLHNKKEIITTCLKTVFVTSTICLAVLYSLNISLHIKYILGIALYLTSSMIYHFILTAVRGLGNSRLYATSGIINSFLLLIFEAAGLIVLGLGVEALLLSKAIANIITIIFIYLKQNEFRGVLKSPYNKRLAKDIFDYSAPLIPNNICWWIVNSSDRYIILFFLGADANGIYSIANKFPTVVTTVTGILYFALQESIIKEYNAPDRDEFYSDVFRKYYLLLFSLVICGIPATRLVIELFTGAAYKTAWMYTGFLYVSTVFSALCGLLGIGYQISRETKRSIISTVSAAFVNIGINIIFVKLIGLHAASFSTLIAYGFLLAIRLNHTKKHFSLMIKWKEFAAIIVITLVILGLTFIVPNLIWCIPLTVGGMLVALYLNKQFVRKLIEKISTKVQG